MQGFTIQPRRSKAEAFNEIRDAILSQCDDDIREAFAIHSFTVEPLLLQLIREMRLLHEYYRSTPSVDVRATGDATIRDNTITHGESAITPEAPNTGRMG